MKLSGWIFFDNTRKNFKLNLVLVLVLALKSKALYCKHISIKFKCKLPRLLRKHSPMFIAEVFNVLLLNLSRKRQTAIRQPFVANLTPDFSINHFLLAPTYKCLVFPYGLFVILKNVFSLHVDISYYLSRLVAARCCHLEVACRTEMFTNTGSNQLIYLLGYLFIYVFLVVEHLRQDNSEHVTQSKGNFFAVIPSRSFCQMMAIFSRVLNSNIKVCI